MITECEVSIVEALKAAMPEFQVEAFPNNPAQYNLMSNNGAVLVAYKGRSFVEYSDCGCYANDLEFVVTFRFRNLRQLDGHQGIYESLELAESALKGIANITGEKFMDFDNGVWEYAQLYKIENLG